MKVFDVTDRPPYQRDRFDDVGEAIAPTNATPRYGTDI
jgi:hypothetical protein